MASSHVRVAITSPTAPIMKPRRLVMKRPSQRQKGTEITMLAVVARPSTESRVSDCFNTTVTKKATVLAAEAMATNCSTFTPTRSMNG